MEDEIRMPRFSSGGISGAITDEYSEEAIKHAVMYYEEIRNNRYDVYRISKNTNIDVEDIIKIKNYLFIDKHELPYGVERFESNFAIAQSWNRLAYFPESIQEHDLVLLRHELKEMELMRQGLSQSEAHEKASKEFDYPRESKTFYEELKLKQSRKEMKRDLNDIGKGR